MRKLQSMEGITQGDPTAVSIYSLGFLLLLNMTTTDSTKYATYVDDISQIGILKNIRTWGNKLNTLGPKTGYFPKAKIWRLILKPEKYETVESIFKDEKLNITNEGKKHLKVVAAKMEYRKKICNHEGKRMAKCIKVTVKNLLDFIHILNFIDILSTWCASTSTPGLRQNFAYFVRTISNISQVLHPIENAIRQKFITSLFKEEPRKDEDGQLLCLM